MNIFNSSCKIKKIRDISLLLSQFFYQVLQGQKLGKRNPKQIVKSMEMAGFHPAAIRTFTALLRVGLLVTDSVLVLAAAVGISHPT